MTATGGIIERESAVLMQTYGRQPVAFVSGDGCWLTDADGKTYLDCLGGLAVVAVGHSNPRVASAVAAQMSSLVHVSNLYFTEPMVHLAERLTSLSGLDRVFFCNDGATANEAAIKLARRYGQSTRGPDCYKVVSLHDSFHGRTLATLAATGQPAKQATFAPLPTGFHQIAAGDIGSLEATIDARTAAVLVETVQGEGGVIPLDPDYLKAVRRLCDETGALLILTMCRQASGVPATGFPGSPWAWSRTSPRPPRHSPTAFPSGLASLLKRWRVPSDPATTPPPLVEGRLYVRRRWQFSMRSRIGICSPTAGRGRSSYGRVWNRSPGLSK